MSRPPPVGAADWPLSLFPAPAPNAGWPTFAPPRGLILRRR
jgi:hypothetical protein